jgi:hypothetical protein
MIWADFLAGASLDHGDPETLLFSINRFFRFLTEDQKLTFLETVVHRTLGKRLAQSLSVCGLIHHRIKACGRKCCVVMVGGVSPAARLRAWKFTTCNSEASREMIPN